MHEPDPATELKAAVLIASKAMGCIVLVLMLASCAAGIAMGAMLK